jgi:hypothetical protein
MGETKINRDDKDRIKDVKTSWGYESHYNYDPKGNPEKIEIVRGGQKFVVTFDNEDSVTFKQFDGGESNITYYNKGKQEGRVKEVNTPNGLALTYDYGSEGEIKSITCYEAYRLKYKYDKQGNLIGMKKICLSR